MSDETKKENEVVEAVSSESSDVSGYFDSLIGDEEFSAAKKEEPKVITMKDFSEFFNDAAASGHGFESTIDSELAPKPDEESESEELDFSSEAKHEPIITEPVTDEDGMIVLYDEEAGIDAISGLFADKDEKADEDAVEVNTENSSVSEKEENIPEETTNTDTVADNPEKAESSDEDKPSEQSQKDEKTPFIRTIIPWKGDSVPEVIRKIVFIASTSVFVAAGIMLISTLVQSEEAVKEKEEILEAVTTTVQTTINEKGEVVTIRPTEEEREEHNIDVMAYFLKRNPDVLGYIDIPACNIMDPVVQGTDNNYYLTHTYTGGTNKAGSIFMDFRCTLNDEYRSPNIVLYGHNQEDGTMFGNLKKYNGNVEFYKENPTFSFNTKYGVDDYVIFGYFVTNVLENQDSNGEVFHYQDYIETLADEDTFNWYMEQVTARNQLITPVDTQFGDKLLVLSTCSTEYTNSRFVIMARLLREDEDLDSFDISEARLNPYAKAIDWNAILGITSPTSEETTVPETTTEETTTTEVTTVPETTTEETTIVTTTTAAPETAGNSDTGTRVSLVTHVNGEQSRKEEEERRKTSATEEETTVPEDEETEESSESETSRKGLVTHGTTY